MALVDCLQWSLNPLLKRRGFAKRRGDVTPDGGAGFGARPLRQELDPPNHGEAHNASSCALISSFLFGYSLCVLDTCLGLLPVVFEWCNNEWQSDCFASRACQALVNASVYLGAAIGALLSGRLYEAGPRFQIMTSDVIFIAGALLGATAQGVIGLLLSRLTSGIGLGLSAIAAPVYIAEVSPREKRGARGALHGVFIGVGIWFSITCGFPQSPPPPGPGESISDLDRWFWRLMLGAAAIPALTQLVLFKWVLPVDPPGFLLQQNKRKEAQILLYKTYGLPPPKSSGKSPDAEQDSAAARVEKILDEMVYACDQANMVKRVRIHQAICDKFFRPALFVGFALAAFQQLSGINALMSYSNALFSQAGIPSSELTLASTVMATCNAFAAVMSSKVVDRWGRRKLLLLGPFLQMTAMFCIQLPRTVVGPTMVLCCFCLFTVSFSAGLGAVTWIYLSEIYIQEIRGAALSTCGVINWLSCFIVVFGMPFLGLHGACKFFGVICLAGFVGVYLFVQETKGCSMDDNPLTPQSDRSKSPLLQCTPNPEEDTASGNVRFRLEHK